MMSRFSKQVDQAVNAQTKGADQVARAYAKQEHAMRSALQQVLNLNAALRKGGAPPEFLARTTNAYNAFTRVLTSGQVSAVTMSRAQDRLAATLAKTRRSFDNFKPPDDKKFGGFAKIMRDIESASVLAVGPLSGLGARIRALASITGRSTLAMAAFLGTVSAIVLGIAKLGTATVSTSRMFDTITSGLNSATGTATVAAQSLEFVAETAQKLGIDLPAAAAGFVRVAAAARGTKMEGAQTKEIFLGIATAGRALNMTGEQVERSLKAIEQMMSKGTVMSEELKNQLGDSLPGAMRLAAAAMGKTTAELQKMMEKGQLLADDFLPKFAKALQDAYGDDAANAANNLNAVQTRLSNTTLLMLRSFDQAAGVSNAFKASLNGLTSVVAFISNNMQTLIAVIGGVTGAFLVMVGPAILSGIFALSRGIGQLTMVMLGLNAAVLANPLGTLVSVIARLAVVAAGAAAGFLLMKNAMQTVDDTSTQLIGEIDKYIARSNKFGSATEFVTDALITQAEKQRELAEAERDAAKARLENARKAAELASVNPMGRAAAQSSSQASIQKAMTELSAAQDVVDRLTLSIAELQKLPSSAPGSVVGISKELETATKKIADMQAELQGFNNAIASRGAGSGLMQWHVDLAKARDLLKEVKAGELPALEQMLIKSGMAGSDAAERLASLIRSLRDAEGAFKGLNDRMEATPKILGELGRELDELRGKTDALNKGPTAFKEWSRMNERTKELESFRQKLAQTSLSQEEITQRTEEYAVALDNLKGAQKTFDRLDEMRKTAVQGFDRAFDRIGSAITDAFVRGEDAAINWGNVVQGVLSEVMQTILEMTIMNPAKQFLGSIFSGMLGSIAPGAGTGASMSPMTDAVSAAGGFSLYERGGLIPMAKGHVLRKPTLIPMSAGMGIAREAGRDEAVMPLTRVSGGDLGVKAMGGGAVTNVYVINNSNAQATTSEQQNSSGGKDITIVIAETIANDIRRNGQVGRAINQSFDVSRRRAAR